MTDDLDAQVRSADPDRWLSSRFIADAAQRADAIALYAYDHELARAPKVASNPLLGEIRLTWWREMLDEVFEGREVRRHPTAQALAQAIRRRGLAREGLEAMIDARYRELDPAPMSEPEAVEWAHDTGGRTATLVAQVLGVEADVADAGAAWSLSFRAAKAPELLPAFERALDAARRAAPKVSPQAFPAVAHAIFAGDHAAGRSRGDLSRRLRLMLAVARGRL